MLLKCSPSVTSSCLLGIFNSQRKPYNYLYGFHSELTLPSYIYQLFVLLLHVRWLSTPDWWYVMSKLSHLRNRSERLIWLRQCEYWRALDLPHYVTLHCLWFNLTRSIVIEIIFICRLQPHHYWNDKIKIVSLNDTEKREFRCQISSILTSKLIKIWKMHFISWQIFNVCFVCFFPPLVEYKYYPPRHL